MTDIRSTQDHYERETQESERLVRPAPKIKPPRVDLRRERMNPDPDPDLENSDPDLSMNYKDIGGSVGDHVVTRWRRRLVAGEPGQVKVKKKDTGWVGYVNKETIKEKPSEYETIEDEDEEGDQDVAGEPTKDGPEPKSEAPEDSEQDKRNKDESNLKQLKELHEAIKTNSAFASRARDLFNQKAYLGNISDDTPIGKLPKQILDVATFPFIKPYKTVGDLRKDLRAQKGLKGLEKGLQDQWKTEDAKKPAPKSEPKSEKPESAAPSTDPAKQRALSEAGKQIRERAKKDPALRTVVEQLEGQDSKALYQLRKQLNPAEDISKAIPGLPQDVRTLGDLFEAIRPSPSSKEQPAEPKEDLQQTVKELARSLQEELGLSRNREERHSELHPDDKAEVEEFVKSKQHETTEFRAWADEDNDTSQDDDGATLFLDEKRRKYLPFEKLPIEAQRDWINRFQANQKTVGNVAALRAKAEKDEHLSKVLKDLANPESDLFQQVTRGRSGASQSVKKSPKLQGLDLPPNIKSVGDLMKAAEELYRPAKSAQRRHVSERETETAERQIIETFPVEVADQLLNSDPPIHPDDVRDLVEHYNTARLHADDDELVDLVKRAGYETNPAKVRAPSVGVNRHGKEVPYDELNEQEKADALEKHRMFVMALSLAAREREVHRLKKKSGAPDELLGAIADFSLREAPGEPDEVKTERATKAAKALFAGAIKSGLMGEDQDVHARWHAQREKLIQEHEQEAREEGKQYDPDEDDDLPPPPAPKEITEAQLKKLLGAFPGNSAAQHLVVGYAQASDYLRAHREFLDPGSPNAISEHDSPGQIAKSIKGMSAFFDEQAGKYPPEMRDFTGGKAHMRDRVVDKVRTLVPEKFPFIKKLVQEQEYDDYEEQLRQWKKEHDKVLKRWNKGPKSKQNTDPYRAEQPPFSPPPTRPEGYLHSRGDKETVKNEREQLFDRFRRQTGLTEAEKTAGMRWRVVDRFLKYSSCTSRRTMGAARTKRSVYWGVEPYPQGKEGFAPYPGWQQAHQRDLGEKDFSALVSTARDWLRAPVLATAMDGIYRDSQLRAALDLAIRSCAGGKYSVGLQPPLYNMLLARLGGASQNDTLLTYRDNIKGSVTGSLYASAGGGEPMNASPRPVSAAIKQITDAYIRTYSDNGQTKAYVEWIDHRGKKGRTEGEPDNPHMQALLTRAKREGLHVKTEKWASDHRDPDHTSGKENHPMKASALIRQAAAKHASTNPSLAYELVDLSTKVAQDEQQGQQGEDEKQKQGGQVPPQFLEHMKKKKEDDKGQDQQGQQKDASYRALRSVVIKMAHANPHLLPAYRPLLETIKKLG